MTRNQTYNKYLIIGHSRVFSPNVVNEFRFGYGRHTGGGRLSVRGRR